MTRIDHAAESRRLIGATDTRDWTEPSPYVDRRIAAAQVHASLAVAEQQRIANLIAYCAAFDSLCEGHKEWIEQEWGLDQ